MNQEYKLPENTRIGHVHLKVSSIEKGLAFYRDLLGFELVTMQGERAAFVSAGSYHHHIGLNVWYSEGLPPAPKNAVGLFHTAIVFPSRKDLAEIYLRIKNAGHPLTSAYDHGVSEALYLNDYDQNGVELYWDRPASEWPRNEDGSIHMYSNPIDPDILLAELE